MRIDYHDPREFEKWFARLAPDERAKVEWSLRYIAGTRGAAELPHVRSIDAELRELRITRGGQPRIYFTVSHQRILVLAVGRKDTQARDISRARRRI